MTADDTPIAEKPAVPRDNLARREIIGGLRNAMWVGWQMESNWTKTWIYFLYAATRPLALCLIIFFIFKFAGNRPGAQTQFLSTYVGNAFFTIFIAVASGISWVVIQDREHYRIIRYIYATPMPFWIYIVGRATVVLAISLVSLAIILTFGNLALGLGAPFSRIDWAVLIPSTVLGIVSAASLGLMFAGVCLVTARHSILMAEGAGAVFLLTCGVIYPLEVLPGWAAAIGKVLPMTYWIELVRRSFGGYNFTPTLADLSTKGTLLGLSVLTVAFALLAFRWFKFAEDRAKKTGQLDMTTNY
ncbi:MAG: ABC transporter permease [Deltaproteobacteria bacterium]|nr:ABC transporter permease [Deltaproteobacteria bacterium]